MPHRIVFLLALALCALVFARPALAECEPQVVGELWAEEDFKIAGIDASVAQCPSWFSSFRYGASYYGHDGYDYKGATASGRLQFGKTIAPYFGYGVLVGLGEKEVPAEFDGQDNNGNGLIDEVGETSTESDLSAFIFPEAGIEFYANGYGIVFSARQYYGKEFSGNVIYSFGVARRLGR